MLTYSSALSTLQTLTGVPSTDTSTSATLIQFWNDSRRTVAGIGGGKWPWLEIEEEALTVASQDYIQIPNHIGRVMSVRQQNGSSSTDVVYRPRMVFDSDKWDTILQTQLGTSNVPYFCYQRGNQLYIQPIPSENGDRVIMHGRLKIKDINIPDVTNLTVTAIANGGTTMTLSGSATADFVGRYIRITQTSAAAGGDGYWYEISGYTNATTVTLKKPYQGTTLAAASAASTIGFITYEPEQYQMAPIYRAVAQYWDLKENMVLSERYWMLYDGGNETGKAQLPAGLIGQMLAEANESMEGPYISPSPRDGSWPYPPYWFPYQDASGF